MNILQRSILRLSRRGRLNAVPDSLYLRAIYWARMGKVLSLQNPRTFNEKMQWLKLYDRKLEYTTMVDKYAAKEYVANIIGSEYIVPNYGVWDSFDDIDFDALPDQFVLKCTHDCGGLVICRDKSKLDIAAARKKINRALKRNYYYSGREWPYKNVKPRILAEAFLEDENGADGLTDYKFFCFGGMPRMLYISRGLEDHATATISFYDIEGNAMPFCRKDFRPLEGSVTLPDNYNEMVVIAEKIATATHCPFVRIDLYSVQNKICFSEITFTPCSGMLPFEPEEWDGIVGSWIELPKEQS